MIAALTTLALAGLPLEPLGGGARFAVFDPHHFALRDASPSGWTAIDTARARLATGSDRDATLAELATLHLDLGWSREALAYVGQMSPEARSTWQVAAVAAEADLRLGRWAEARVLCAPFSESEPRATECLAITALADGSPFSDTTAVRPEGQALVGSLALRDGDLRTAATLLDMAVQAAPDAHWNPRARVVLGDALFANGDRERAETVWTSIRSDSSARGVASLRVDMLRMLEQGPGHWDARVRRLRDLSLADDALAPEAVWLLGEAAAATGDWTEASREFAEFETRWPDRARASAVPDRLHEACVARIAEASTDPDATVAFIDCWRDADLDGSGLHALDRAIEGARDLGLPELALEAAYARAHADASRGVTDPAAATQLAGLYVDHGLYLEALDTVVFVRKDRDAARSLEPQLLLAEGRALVGIGDTDRGLTVLARAVKADPAARPVYGLALVRAGRCAEAIDLLDPTGETAWYRARCLLDVGRIDEANALATQIRDDKASDPALVADAEWLVRVSAAALHPDQASGNPLFEAIAADARADRALGERLAAHGL